MPSGRTVDPLLAQAFANEVLERRPRTARHVQKAVDLPLGEELRVGAPGVGPVGHLRQAPEIAREPCALLDRAIEPLLADGQVEPRLAQRVRERSEGVRVRRGRRDRPTSGGEIARPRCPPELLAERAELREQVVAREESPREEAGGALCGVPRAEVLDDGLRMHARIGVLRELAHRRRPAESLRGLPKLLEDLVVRVAPPQTRTKRGELRLVDAHARALA